VAEPTGPGARTFEGAGTRNALVEFDTGERVVGADLLGWRAGDAEDPPRRIGYQGSPGRESQLIGAERSRSGEVGVDRM